MKSAKEGPDLQFANQKFKQTSTASTGGESTPVGPRREGGGKNPDPVLGNPAMIKLGTYTVLSLESDTLFIALIFN